MSSSHVIIIGGGTAGITIAARLRKAAKVNITIIDPAERHYYQPLWTLVGGGLASFEETDRAMADQIPKGVTWEQDAVAKIDPEAKTVHTKGGKALTYDALVVAPGIRLAFEEIEGFTEALDNDPRVWTNYSPKYVNKGVKAIEAFKKEGGRAFFSFPQSPVKCGGGPQKIMWITEDILRSSGVRDKAEITFIAPGAAIFGVPKYRDALQVLVEERDIHTQYKHHVVAIDHTKSEVTLENVETKERHTEAYDLMHITPPQRAFAFVGESGLGDAAGFVNVNRETLQHVTYPEIFSAGDASSAPTAKTGAAVRKQAPTLVANLVSFLNGKAPSVRYDGYTSCPLVVGQKHVMLAEFGYDGSILETFPFNQAKPRRSMFFLKRTMLPIMYWNGMLKGRA
jgi:sulfide:quinone oxidoreductase